MLRKFLIQFIEKNKISLDFFNLKKLNNDFTIKIIFSFFINFGKKFLVLISSIIFIRFLGKEDYGIYIYVLSIINVLLIPFEFGISTLIVKETSKGISIGEHNKVLGVWLWSLFFTIILSIVIILPLFLASIFVSDYFSTVELITFRYSLLLLPLHSIILIISATLRGLNNIVEGQLPNLIFLPLFSLLLTIFTNSILNNEITATSAIIIRFIATLIVLFITFAFFWYKAPNEILHLKPTYNSTFWFNSVKNLGLSNGLIFFRAQANILIPGIFLDPLDIATFQVSFSLIALSGIIIQTINPIISPLFSSLYSSKKIDRIQRIVKISAQINFIFTLVISILFVIFGKVLLEIFFGKELIVAYPILLILLIGQIINSYYGPVAVLLNMTGHEKYTKKAVSLSTSLNLILLLLVTPVFGIKGAAISTIIGSISSQFLMHKYVKKRINIESIAYRIN